MSEASRSIVIDRPLDEVFAFFADAENDPKWRTGVKEIRRLGDLAVGAKYHQRVAGPAGSAIAADLEVTAYEPGVRVAFHTIAGPVRPDGEYRFRAVAGATEVTFSLSVELSGIKRVAMGQAVQKSMDAEVAGLDRAKSVLETRD
ncbi:SRPBCC family protein [Pengzhenrongella sp.]|jgi:uncharacterized membrane protein|uniref:SRPBCC family protein n=1 Tax=Pengzhenrongella sp. TaxID=2888820 RepID=UPI002F9434D5